MKTTFEVVFILVLNFCISIDGLLLWPQYTVLQVTAAFSVPVEIPKRKVYFDWGFQFNYDLPYNGSNIWNTPIWPGHTRRSLPDTNSISPTNSIDYEKYRRNSTMHPSDLTAGEFYMSLENLLESYGFHETCLLKSVCELARHPFDKNHENILTELITFALSPSIHQAFADDEKEYENVYTEAEVFGKNGENCKEIYPLCRKDILNILSKVRFI